MLVIDKPPKLPGDTSSFINFILLIKFEPIFYNVKDVTKTNCNKCLIKNVSPDSNRLDNGEPSLVFFYSVFSSVKLLKNSERKKLELLK